MCAAAAIVLPRRFARAVVLARLFGRFDAVLRERGHLPMGGQIVVATVIEARRPRLTKDEKQMVRDGGTPSGWSKARAADGPRRALGDQARPQSTASATLRRKSPSPAFASSSASGSLSSVIGSSVGQGWKIHNSTLGFGFN